MVKKFFIILLVVMAFYYSSKEIYWYFLLEKQKSYIEKSGYRVEEGYEDLIDAGLKIKPENFIFRYEKMRICLTKNDYECALNALLPVQDKWEAKQFICAIYDYLNYPEQEVKSCYKEVVDLMYKKKNAYSNDVYVIGTFLADEISCAEAYEQLIDHSMKEILMEYGNRKQFSTELINRLSGKGLSDK